MTLHFFALHFGATASGGKREPVNSTMQVNAAVYCRDATRVAFGRQDGTVEVWDTASLRQISLLNCEQPVAAIAMDSKGDKLVVACVSDASTCFVFKRVGNAYAPDRQLQFAKVPRKPELDSFDAVAFSPDDKWLACASMNKIRLFDAREFKLRKMLYETGNGIADLAFSSDSSKLVTAGQTLRTWDLKRANLREDAEDSENWPIIELQKREEKFTGFKLGSWAVSTAIGADGASIFGAGVFERKDNGIPVRLTQFDLYSGRPIRTFATGPMELTSIAVTSDRQLVAAGERTGIIQIWKVENGFSFRNLKPGLGLVRQIAFCPSGQDILIAGDKMTPEIWNYQTGQLKRRLMK